MLGAIIGDIIGSSYEFGATKRIDFELFTSSSRFTDDSVLPEALHSVRLQAKSGDKVLLSPMFTSFDMFDNFEERGSLFKKTVNELS